MANSRRTIGVGRRLLDGSVAELEWVTPADVEAAWQTFRQFGDKEWSFTDCVSRAVIERLNISTAFAFDEHFRQFGNVHVVPI